MAYLKILMNPKDELSFKRAISLHRGIGRGFAIKIWERYTKNRESFSDIEKGLPKRQQEGFKEFSSLINALKKISTPQDAIRKIMEFYKNYCYLSFDNADERIMDLEELAKMAADYPTIRRFLVELSSYEEFKSETLLSTKDQDEILILSTIHQAKGLEWEAVFIIGFSDYEFPHPKALDCEEAIEEERRLFYVATTRTKTLLHVSYPETKYTFKNGLIISRPSIFFYELSNKNYEEMFVQEDF
ncbi:MAG: ATP-dependent helicase [Candidatus Omnitrophota bacterium]|nr:MAG: ATP-dependent helicase [Candidatus Omnitrophota bacterium]